MILHPFERFFLCFGRSHCPITPNATSHLSGEAMPNAVCTHSINFKSLGVNRGATNNQTSSKISGHEHGLFRTGPLGWREDTLRADRESGCEELREEIGITQRCMSSSNCMLTKDELIQDDKNVRDWFHYCSDEHGDP